ncbi:Sodium-coupled neutral amino acid transporter [Scale drop disease virus]|uniref:ORF_082R n=1 Tax=Scale drop disease virus TaxID=1697349 RepID=A0A0K1L698_9VIRU|nr:ORF_082R [Scale drop disease virus]AKU37497.1 ORF_082R [Scale drop disease virus]QLI60756.1 Sodium-coupled neutral amino acid transporter [Scale drop disease virus]QXJ13674.1 ORF082R [Scale drop disease virus]UNH60699.1 Sodium-coupled neutral amino acid transporter [Scale drop disease virus]
MYASVFLHTINCMIGSGILALPYTANLLGYGLYIFFCVALAIWAFVSLAVLFDCTSEYDGNLEDLCRHAFGKPGFIVMSFLLMFENIGSICSYLFVILNMCKTVIPYFDARWSLAAIILIVLFPISIPKSIKGLGIFSFAAIIFINGFVSYVVVNLGIHGVSPNATSLTTNVDAYDIPHSMSILMFAYVCHPTAITLAKYGSDRRKTLTAFMVAFIICTIIYLIMGICGYAAFGTETPDNMLQAYNSEKYGVVGKYVVPILIALSIMFTIPALLIPLKKIIANIDCTYNQWLSSLLGYVLMYLIVIFVPKFENILSIVGATAASSIMFICSPCLYLKLVNKQSCVAWFLLVIGIVATVICITTVVYGLVV